MSIPIIELDDNKNNGLITKIWGPAMWESIHCIAFGYPIEPTEEQKQNYKNFFLNLMNVLPCKFCRDSYKDFVTKEDETILRDEDFENRESLTKFVFKIHNRVNKKLGINYNICYDDFVFIAPHSQTRSPNKIACLYVFSIDAYLKSRVVYFTKIGHHTCKTSHIRKRAVYQQVASISDVIINRTIDFTIFKSRIDKCFNFVCFFFNNLIFCFFFNEFQFIYKCIISFFQLIILVFHFC